MVARISPVIKWKIMGMCGVVKRRTGAQQNVLNNAVTLDTFLETMGPVGRGKGTRKRRGGDRLEVESWPAEETPGQRVIAARATFYSKYRVTDYLSDQWFCRQQSRKIRTFIMAVGLIQEQPTAQQNIVKCDDIR